MALPYAHSPSRLAPLLAAVCLSSACVRAPLSGACPEVAPGELVITEIRQDQGGAYRPWIELYNASDAAVELAGLRLTMQPSDGAGTSKTILVRDEALVVEPGDYVVLGGGDPAVFDYIDYSTLADLHSGKDPSVPTKWPEGQLYELSSCGARIDLVVVRTLPKVGTLAWPGEPDAAANDDSDRGWCVDQDGAGGENGVRGTPGGANPSCA